MSVAPGGLGAQESSPCFLPMDLGVSAKLSDCSLISHLHVTGSTPHPKYVAFSGSSTAVKLSVRAAWLQARSV